MSFLHYPANPGIAFFLYESSSPVDKVLLISQMILLKRVLFFQTPTPFKSSLLHSSSPYPIRVCKFFLPEKKQLLPNSRRFGFPYHTFPLWFARCCPYNFQALVRHTSRLVILFFLLNLKAYSPQIPLTLG